jgi:alpha-ketoglutarate-dependent taurine dioxygenase
MLKKGHCWRAALRKEHEMRYFNRKNPLQPKVVSYSRSRRAADDVKDALQENKIVLLTGYDGNKTDLLPFYERLADAMGDWVPLDEDLVTQEKTGGRWIEIRYDPQISNAYRYSSNRQPMHTDGAYESNAPDIAFFFCLNMDVIGGATTFVDSWDLLNYLERYSPQLMEDCQRIPVTFKKGSDSKTRPIIAWQEDEPRLTWNYYPVLETSPEVANLRKQFHDFLEHKVVEGGLCLPVPMKPGDALFFHDDRLLHGRNSFIAQKTGDRFLLKGGLRLAGNRNPEVTL